MAWFPSGAENSPSATIKARFCIARLPCQGSIIGTLDDRVCSQIAVFARYDVELGEEPTTLQLQEHGRIKYGAEDLLASSAGLGWRGIAAEHRRHPKGLLPSFQPQHMEIGIATGSHPECVVSRTGDRLRQHTRVEPGTIWLCPVGVLEEDIQISAWHEVLHLYLAPERFAQLSEVRGGAASRPDAVRYLGGIYDERVRRMGIGLLRELRAPSSAGTMLLDMLTLRLTEWLVDSHSSHVGRATRRSDRL